MKAIGLFDDQVKDFQKRSLQVLPLKLRRETLLEPIPVEALCDFNTIDVRNSFSLGFIQHFA